MIKTIFCKKMLNIQLHFISRMYFCDKFVPWYVFAQASEMQNLQASQRILLYHHKLLQCFEGANILLLQMHYGFDVAYKIQR